MKDKGADAVQDVLEHSTGIVIHLDFCPIVRHPGGYTDEVSDERRNQALQEGGVSVQDVFVDYAGLVELVDH